MMRWFSIILLALVINLPLGYGSIQNHRLDGGAGVQTTGTVVSARVTGGEYWIAFTLPAALDPGQRPWPAHVGRTTYERALADHTVSVRVLRGDPKINRVDGEITSHLAWWFTGAMDLVLVFLVWGLWRRGRRPEHLEEYVAVEDVTRGVGPPALEPLDDGTHVVAGDIEAVGDGYVDVETPVRRVRVHLDGHANPVGAQQAMRVRARVAP